MRAAERVRALALSAGLMGLAACSTTPVATGPELGRNGSVVVAQVQPGETADAIARRYSGRGGEGWRVTALDGGALKPGSAAVVSLGADAQGAQVRVPIICYHRFTDAARPKNAMEVTASDLKAQLGWLKDNGYHVVRLSDLAAFLHGGASLPSRPVVITVDDGYASLYETAFPIFTSYSAPFTAFVIGNMVETRAGLTWDQLKRMRDGGLADIETHTQSHPDLRKRARKETYDARRKRLDAEIETPRRQMAEHLGGAQPRFFAYPYGAADADVVKDVRQADVSLALTVQRGGNAAWSDPLLLHRDMVYGTDGVAGFARHVQAAEGGGR